MTTVDALPDDPMQQTSTGVDPDEGMAGVAVDDDDALVFDLDAVDERGTFELIPAGIYDATVDNVEYQRLFGPRLRTRTASTFGPARCR